ncbi:Myb/SANT-like domain [Macleaya cordata]|uniref:Myb/SANT-like domain n=1 Tax=Macleaya cordata TaxID=56857 RepID=A0A200QA43_MACCD|nr:Myb/SANT-like domain [Macleaya cordata]
MASRPSRSTRQSRPNYTQSHQEQARAKWTTPLTNILADLMVEEVVKGNKQNNSFGKKAWKNICDEFHKKTGLKWDREQLKNRYGVLRRHYTTMKSLLDLNDFTWDESRQIVMATDEVWDEYIKAHPDAETIRANGCPLYKQLCVIFSESGTNGSYDPLNQLVEMEEDPCPKVKGLSIDTGAPLVLSQEESLSTSEEDEESIPSMKNKQQVMTPSTGRKRNRMGIEDLMLKAILEMAASSKLRAAAVTEGSDRFSITNCVKALDEMQGVDDHLYYTALDLFDKPNLRETFMSLKIEKRLVWLKGKCNAVYSSMA